MSVLSHGLVVTTYFPQDASFAHGVYRRLDVLMEALSSACERLTVLVFVWSERPYSEAERAEYERYLSRRWSTSISLRLSATKDRPRPGRRVSGLLGGMVSFARTDPASRLRNAGAAAALAAALAEGPQIVLVHRLEAMSVVLRQPRDAIRGRLYFDLDDVEHVAQFRRLLREPEWPTERVRLLHVPAVMAGEAAAIHRATATFVCSDHDRRYLERLFLTRSVRVVPNAAAIDADPPVPSAEPVVLFVGAFDFSPNAHAAGHLVGRIWPAVRRRVPDARLFVVGRCPDYIPGYAEARRDETIAFTGFVDDIRAYYARTRVVCCPIRVGAGTRVKIIEAAGVARPVVTTPLGAEGLDFADGDEIVLRRDDDAIAAACCDLLVDGGRAARIGEAAWRKARAVYDRKAVVRLLRGVFAGDGERVVA